MSKEFEALSIIIETLSDDKGRIMCRKELDILIQALQCLDEIDQTNPSEALGCLHTIAFNTQINGMNFGDELRTIKQALIKLQKQAKVIKIINEKGLPLGERDMILHSKDYEEYTIKFSWANFKNISIQKAKEEFKLLKEVLK